MKRTPILVAIMMATTVSAMALADAPELLPPLSMQTDPGTLVSAIGMDFLEHPKSGSTNFSPTNYDIHLPGNITLPVQDVIPYFGIRPPIGDCKTFAQTMYETIQNTFTMLTTILGKISGMNIPKQQDPTMAYDGLFKECTAMPADKKEVLLKSAAIVRQNVADLRNTAGNSTDVIFSGAAVAPYSGGFPIAGSGYAGVVVGDTGNGGSDLWNDAVILAGYIPVIKPDLLNTPVLNSSLAMFRFLPNLAGNTSLQFAGYSSAWLDRPSKDNVVCFDTTDPQNPVLWPYATLLKNGCVGEHFPTGIVTLNLFNHANPKMKDLVVVSRAPYGSDTDMAAKVGYLTVYKRNESLQAPADSSLFQDIWRFEKSVTHPGTGIPEPYGIAVIKNGDPKVGKVTEGVIVGSNQLFGAPQFGTQYYVYYFASGMDEPKPISVGEGFNPELPGLGGYGPYRVYSADINADHCGDILITRAKIGSKGSTIRFADYFDVHLQVKTDAAGCTGDFDKKGNKYQLPPVEANNVPQISSLAIADFNKDGRVDVMAADFTTYMNKTTGSRENVVHFLENKGGILNTVQPPHYVVTTKSHPADIGPIDIKADAYANLGVVTGEAPHFEPIKLPSKSTTCGVGGVVYQASWLDIESQPGVNNDLDNDGIPDCIVYTSGGNPTTGGCKMSCDNCSLYNAPKAKAEACKADPSQCANEDQKDSDNDKTGDACDAFPNDGTQSRFDIKPLPIAKYQTPMREDRVIYSDEQPVIAEYQELKTVDAVVPKDNGHEVVVLLNKTVAKDTKKECVNGDLACICEKNPDLLACKCLKDPKLPQCQPPQPGSPPVCSVDVCRGDLTAPYARQCEFIRPFNDEIRKCTGLSTDFLIPVEGVQYHVSCTMPNTPALDLGNGLAYTRVFKTGQVPKNYFKEWRKPVAEENLLAKPVLLNQPPKAQDGTELDLSPLPKPGFDNDPLLAVVPEITLNEAPGITQIDGVMEIQTNLVDLSGVPGAAKAAGAGAATKVLTLDVKGFSSPPGCQWGGDDCPRPMVNPPSAREFVNAICAKADEAKAAGKTVTLDTVNEAFNAMNVGPAFLHQKLVIPGAQGSVVIPMQNTMGGISAEGGCGCTIGAASTIPNTVIPLLMSAAALGGILIFRRNTAKKR